MWFVRCKRAICGPFFRLQRWCSNVQSKFVCTWRQATLQRKHGTIWDMTQREITSSSTRTRHSDGGRRATTYREEYGRPHPEPDFHGFRLEPLVKKGEDGESRSHLTRRRACAESDSRPTFAEDGHQDDGLESSTYTITRLYNFRGGSGSLYIGLSLLLCVYIFYWFCGKTRQKCLCQNSAAWCLRCTPSLMRSDPVSAISLLPRTCC